MEQFNVLKTNRHSQQQKRILVIDGDKIYHIKQEYDPVSGKVKDPRNNFKALHGKSQSSSVDHSLMANRSMEGDFDASRTVDGSLTEEFKAPVEEEMASPVKQGKVRFPRLANFMAKNVFVAKQRVRFSKNILQVQQFMDSSMLGQDKFYVEYKDPKARDFHRSTEFDEEDEVERKVIYQVMSADMAQYIVAKLIAQKDILKREEMIQQ